MDSGVRRNDGQKERGVRMNASRVAERSVAYALQSAMEPTLGTSFDLMATAPQGVAKLRELILSLAIRGKLLRQRADDASVNDVLHRTDTAKGTLITSQLIKASKPPRKISFEDVPFDLPENWHWVTLAELCATLTDGDHLPPPKADDGVPFLVIGDVRSGHVNLETASRFVTRSYFEGLDWSRRPMAGDILYTTVGSYGIPVPIVVNQEFCFQRHIALIRPALSEMQAYLSLALASPFVFEQATAVATGIAQKTVPLSAMRNFKIPLPPLAEQARIVARVEELMQLCDALEAHGRLQDEQHARLVATLFDALAASASADELTDNSQRIAAHFDLLLDRPESVDALEQTILQLAVRGLLVRQDSNDEPASTLLARIPTEQLPKSKAKAYDRVNLADATSFDIPRGWAHVSMGDVFDFINGYAFKSGWFKSHGIRLVRNVNVAHGLLDWGDTACIDTDRGHEFERFALSKGDVVISLDRPIISTGLKYAVIKESDLPCLLLQRVARLATKSNTVTDEFTKIWLNSPQFISSIDPGRSNGVPHISTKQLSSTPFFLPPLAEQRRIVARVEQLRGLCADLRERLQQSRATQSRLADELVAKAGQ
jgi:type I restriction enzyme S subunit